MKAVIYKEQGEPHVLKIGEVNKPTLNADEVLVEVKASGINPVDTYFRSGVRPVDSFPNIPHFDLAGKVVEIGNLVNGVQVGDRVWATNAKGASAEFAAVKGDLVFPLPDQLNYTDGAAVAMAFMTAHLSLFFRGNIQPNETVLIYGGAGAVGHAAIQLAKQANAHVISTASDKEKEAIAKNAGADEVILYKEEDIVSRVMEITENKGVQLILDMSLSENIDKDLEMISLGGRIVTIGSPVNNTPPLPWRLLNLKHAALLGVFQFSAPIDQIKLAGTEISKGLSSGELKAHIGQVFQMSEAAAAHECLEQKKRKWTHYFEP